MANKSLLLLVVFAMLLSSATASIYITGLKAVANDPSIETMAGLLVLQVWGFITPLLLAPLELWLLTWYKNAVFTLKFGDKTATLSIPALLAVAGLGNFHVLWFTIVQTVKV